MSNLTGQRFIEIVAPILKERGIKKSAFCEAIGVSTNMFSNYAKGAEPKASKVEAAEKFLGIRFSDYEEAEKSSEDEELAEYLEYLRTRSEMRMLFKLAKNASKEDVEQAVKIIEALRK